VFCCFDISRFTGIFYWTVIRIALPSQRGTAASIQDLSSPRVEGDFVMKKLPAIGLAAGLAASLAVGFASTSLAQSRAAAPQVMGSSFGFQLDPAHANATLSISGPNNFHASSYSKSGSPGIDLSQFGALADGIYNYQLTAAGPGMVAASTSLDDGRAKPATAQSVGVAWSGTFQVKGGTIIKAADTPKSERRDR
jgi:hypothetical protein